MEQQKDPIMACFLRAARKIHETAEAISVSPQEILREIERLAAGQEEE